MRPLDLEGEGLERVDRLALLHLRRTRRYGAEWMREGNVAFCSCVFMSQPRGERGGADVAGVVERVELAGPVADSLDVALEEGVVWTGGEREGVQLVLGHLCSRARLNRRATETKQGWAGGRRTMSLLRKTHWPGRYSSPSGFSNRTCRNKFF